MWAHLTAAAVIIALGVAPMFAFGADHLDAPGIMPPSARADLDINDLYVFQGHNPRHTVLALSTHPAAGAIAPLAYASDGQYKIKIDVNGDAIKDWAYIFRFRKPDHGRQWYTVYSQRRREEPKKVGSGWTNRVVELELDGDADAKVFAGLRSDPFFFDLDAFKGAVLGMGGRTFCDGSETDFFAPLNVNAIVLEVPDSSLARNIGVWATTRDGNGRVDRMGRPAINTVFNSGDDKNAFNAGFPKNDPADFAGNVKAVLKAFSSLDAEGPYTKAQRNTLAGVLLPDVVTYDTSTAAAGPLNGRALSDDVIDAELNIVTGGFPFPGRDATGAITGDCVGPHTDYKASFPYLGTPH
jgi:hypothetical protein